MFDSKARGGIGRRIGILTGAALAGSLAASAVPAVAAPVQPGRYVDRGGAGRGLQIFAARCTPSTPIRCSPKRKVRVMSANGTDIPPEDLQCRPPEGYGGQTAPPIFTGLFFNGTRIARNRTFKSTVREVEHRVYENVNEFGHPDGTTWTTEDTTVYRITGRFGDGRVEGSYEAYREVKLVEGAPRSGWPALGTCTTGVIRYAATIKRR